MKDNDIKTTLPIDSQARKDIPIMTGVLDYFPAALAYVARVSKEGNDKHNPGEPLHHARGKSMDHADCAVRHLVERGTIDPGSKLRHTGMAAWRVLAELQEELEREEGAPLARAARLPKEDRPVGPYESRWPLICGHSTPTALGAYYCTLSPEHTGLHEARYFRYSDRTVQPTAEGPLLEAWPQS